MRRQSFPAALGLAAILATAPLWAAPDSSIRESKPGIDTAWRQWAGPSRNFVAPASKLAERWAESGPKELWRRELGGGHSSILFDAGVLYTMYRSGEHDVVAAISAETGETVWETRYEAPMKPDMDLTFGPGPHATPLIAGDRIFTVNATVVVHALDKKTGAVLWKRDLMEEMEASHLSRGYGASPLAYGDMIILHVAGKECGLAAFRQSDGGLIWRTEALRPSYSSPILAEIGGEAHVVAAAGTERLGFDPATGKVHWRHTVEDQEAAMIATPVFVPPDVVFFSCAYGGGSRALRIARRDGEYKVEDLWHTRKMQVQHGSIVVVDGAVYASTGDFGPAFLARLNLSDGEVSWRQRGFAKANFVYGDGKFVILDETGELALATVGPEGFDVHSRVKLLEEKAWTAPTLVGSKLYLRDYQSIRALDLGVQANP